MPNSLESLLGGGGQGAQSQKKRFLNNQKFKLVKEEDDEAEAKKSSDESDDDETLVEDVEEEEQPKVVRPKTKESGIKQKSKIKKLDFKDKQPRHKSTNLMFMIDRGSAANSAFRPRN